MGVVGKLNSENLKVDPSFRIAIVQALFNQEITKRLTVSAKSRLIALGLREESITVLQVPGALELPLALALVLQENYDGAIAAGCVIRGETTHYEYVCQGVERGCTILQLETKKPIAQAVLTTENKQQALDRCGGSAGDKGEEAAEVLISMLNLKRVINNS